jgi:DNA-binding Xre family transcriptional regulator
MKLALDPAKLRAVRKRQARPDSTGADRRRPATGWSKAELARRVGKPVTHIKKMEAGEVTDVKLSTLASLCTALGCRPEELIKVEN